MFQIVRDDGVGDRRGRGEAVAAVDEDVDSVRDQHLHCRSPRRLGQPVGVAGEEQGPLYPLKGPLVDHCLGDRQDMALVECGVQAGASVTGGAERDALGGPVHLGLEASVGPQERVEINEILSECGLTGAVVHLGFSVERLLAAPVVTARLELDYGPDRGLAPG